MTFCIPIHLWQRTSRVYQDHQHLCRVHAGDYSSFAVFLRHVLHPCFECLESGLCVAELQRFLCILIVAPVKCSGIMSLTSDINTNDQSFFSYGAIFAFCVLQFILDTSLFNKIFTNRPKSVILFYSEVFFSQPSFLEFPIFELYRRLLFYNNYLPITTITVLSFAFKTVTFFPITFKS